MTLFGHLQQEHPNFALILLGISIGITAVLDITGVFTNSWICYGKNCTGIVPFDSTEPAWLSASSWMLFVSIGVMVIMIAAYIVIVIEVLKRGYHFTVRKWLIFFRLLAVLYLFLIVISILVFLPNYATYKRENTPYSGQNEAGWSCWLTTISIVAIGFIELFAHLAQRQCIAN